MNQTTLSSPEELDNEPIGFYWGVDPSAPSMTIGNLAAAMMVRHFIDHGHRAVLLVGGATGMIGDPDGKAEERTLKTQEEINANKAALAAQYGKIFGGQNFTLVDNYDWFKDMGYLEFLRDIGKHVPMRQMLGRDFVQKRLAENGAGISYAEFSYVLIQAYDFLYMNREMDIKLQVCGSDQWGNSIAGVDLIRRISGREAHVWSTPLIINKATGVKFGKSEEGAVWLDPELTSVYKFYQFWLNVDDEGVEDYLKVYTLLSQAEVEHIMREFRTNPPARLAQKRLAYEVTKLVHGEAEAEDQKLIAEVLFGSSDPLALDEPQFQSLSRELPVAIVPKHVGLEELVNALVTTALADSKSEARRFLTGGAIYINNVQINDTDPATFTYDMPAGFAVIRRGKNTSAILQITP